MIKEEAIEILPDMRAEYNIFSDDEEEATRYHALSWAIQALNKQKRTGRWRPYPIAEDCLQCSECGVLRIGDQSNYCPNCGAQMEVTNNG